MSTARSPAKKSPRKGAVQAPLAGVCALVDVRVGEDGQIDCSGVVANKLQELGATIVKRFSPKLTHLVLSDFSAPWKDKMAKWQEAQRAKAEYRELQVVSQLWVNACFMSKKHVDEKTFFPMSRGAKNSSSGAGAGAAAVSTATSRSTEPTESRAGDAAMRNDAVDYTPTRPSRGAQSSSAKKRRAQSMEPMPSDAILKMLGSSQKKEKAAAKETQQEGDSDVQKCLDMSSVRAGDDEDQVEGRVSRPKRRRTIAVVNEADTAQTALKAQGRIRAPAECVDESESEDEALPVEAVEEATVVTEEKKEDALVTETTAPAQGWTCSSCGTVNARLKRICSSCRTRKGTPKASVQPDKRASAKTLPKKVLPKAVKATRATTAGKQDESTPSTRQSTRGGTLKLKRPLPSTLTGENPTTKRQRKTRTATSSSTDDLPVPASLDNNIFEDEKLQDKPATTTTTSTTTTPAPRTPSKSATSKASTAPTSAKKTPSKPRMVIGITGVDSETRGVIECAVHAIEANYTLQSGHKKARVVKSLDYAAAVTHLVVGKDTRRTIKVLFAIARGAWIVSESWVFASLEKEQWLDEQDHVLPAFANEEARTNAEKRQVFKYKKFFVGSNVEPSREVLHSLVQCAGGEIVNQISVANVCICGDGSLFRRAKRTGVTVVTPKWVFDSIASLAIQDHENYGIEEETATAAAPIAKRKRAPRAKK